MLDDEACPQHDGSHVNDFVLVAFGIGVSRIRGVVLRPYRSKRIVGFVNHIRGPILNVLVLRSKWISRGVSRCGMR